MVKMPVVMKRVQDIGIAAATAAPRQAASHDDVGKQPPHPIRSARANRPVGLNIRTAMMSRKPMASR